MNIILESNKPDKRFDAVIDGKKMVPFGSAGISDYTLHKEPERKERYISRHKKNEDWTKAGIKTPGFYAKHVLWNKPTLKGSVDDLNRKLRMFILL